MFVFGGMRSQCATSEVINDEKAGTLHLKLQPSLHDKYPGKKA